MKKTLLSAVIVIQLFLVACVTKAPPEIDDLKQLDQQQAQKLLLGNTLTYEAIWGRWAEYHTQDYTGHGAAWGTLIDWFGWSGDEATSTFNISDTGEICWRYTGENEWANPELEYCGIIYRDYGFNYYLINTENPRDPGIVGVLKKLEIKQGDYYDLAE